jgi:hypothetical protein
LNKAASFGPERAARILSAGGPTLAGSMPRSWVYMMALLVACLVASMVIAAIRLL